MKLVTPEYWSIRAQLKQLLNQPLAGGRGAQAEQDRQIHHLCAKLIEFDQPDRFGFDEDHRVDTRTSGSVKRSHRAEGRNFVD